MSKFSGKCDLYDHIMMGKLYPSTEYPNVYVSDEMECFEIFKEATGGVIYQSMKIEVNESNQKLVSELCNFFTVEELPKVSPRSKQKYKYTYFNKECTLKDINKQGVYIEFPIHFNTLLDIIPYYPYIVTFATESDGKQKVVISNRSYVYTQLEEHLSYGHIPFIDYNAELQKHYIDVVNRYFNKEDREVTKTFILDPKLNIDLSNFYVDDTIDYNWPIDVKRDKHLWIYSTPKIIDADKGIIDISKVWPDDVLDSITLTYVQKQEPRKLYLE